MKQFADIGLTRKIKPLRGYKARSAVHGPSVDHRAEHLQQAFTVGKPGQVWITDSTYAALGEAGCILPSYWTCMGVASSDDP